MNNSFLKKLTLSLSSGLCFWLAWPVMPLSILIFLVFIPILLIEKDIKDDRSKRKNLRYFLWTYFTFFVWNISTTWWVSNSTLGGAVMMLVLNSFLMSLPMLFYRYTKNRTSETWGLVSLVLYWLTFEYGHLNWDLSWPWLTLGNAFATHPAWVQWYQYTGVLGGSVWILTVNLLLYFAIIKSRNLFSRFQSCFKVAFLFLGIPMLISYVLYWTYEEKGTDVEVAVVQPNIDPFTEKFESSPSFIPFLKQVERLVNLSEEVINPNTKFLLWPETAIDKNINEANVAYYDFIKEIRTFKAKYPNLGLLTGLTSHIIYGKEDQSETSRFQEGIGFYDVFNTALYIDKKDSLHFYHKSKLVPGPETIIFPKLFKHLSSWFDLGGTFGVLGKGKEPIVMYENDSTQGFSFAPSICYESIYGDFSARFIKNGASMIFIITNDGWWGNTPGHKQHFAYARLRAIETRRDIARSANTGISGFINQRGDVLLESAYDEQAKLSYTIKSNSEVTTYVRYGDYLGRILSGLAIIVFLSAFVKARIK